MEYHGVGALPAKKLVRDIDEVEPVNGRIMKVVSDTVPKLHIVNVYAPQFGRPTAEKEEFLETLHKVVGKIVEKDQHVVIGDFNAKLNGRT